MGNDDIIDIDLKDVQWEVDMHGYPVYTEVLKVQEELKEAYENYAKLLAKYGFWENITK